MAHQPYIHRNNNNTKEKIVKYKKLSDGHLTNLCSGQKKEKSLVIYRTQFEN